MFTIQCTTCNAKLAVKNDALIGQILACPQCGGMVLVERPSQNESNEGTPADLAPPVYKKFPEAFSSETESGIINKDERELNVPPPVIGHLPSQPALSESELKFRKVLLLFLGTLLIILLIAIGLLFSFKGNGPRQDLEPTTPQSKPKNQEKVPTKNSAETAAGSKNEVKSFEIEKERSEQTLDNDLEKSMSPPSESSLSPPLETSAELPDSAEKTGKEQPPAVAVKTPTAGDSDDAKNRMIELLQLAPGKEPDASKQDEHASPVSEELRASINQDSEEKTETTNDLLSGIQRKLPGLIDSSAVLTQDISERLSLPLTELKLNDTPLISVLRSLSSLTEIPMTVDVDELLCRGIRIDQPINCQINASTIGNALKKILEPLELEPIIENQQILISVSAESREKIHERRFDVSDLVEKTQNAVDLRGQPVSDGHLTVQRLASVLCKLVDPIAFDSTRGNAEGGPGLQVDGSILILRHRLCLLEHSTRIIEQLRVLRNLPQKTDLKGEDLAPEVFGWDAVEQSMTLNYYQPTPLDGVLAQIESATKIRILVDHQALHRALTPLNTIQVTVRCNRGTVNEALQRLLSSVDIAILDYRIVGAELLEISTQDALRRKDKMSVEIHRYETPGKPLAEGETPESLIRIIQDSLAPESWGESGNISIASEESKTKGQIYIDRPSGCLFVRQSQPIQRQLRLWLGQKLNKENSEIPASE